VLGSARAATAALLAVLLLAAVGAMAVAPGRGRRRAAGPDPLRGAVGTGVLALGAAAAVLASCVGHLAAREHGSLASAAADRAVVVLEGVVVGEPQLDPAPWPTSTPVRAVVRVERLTVRGRVAVGTGEVLVTGDAAWLAYPAGSRVRAVGRLAPLTGRRPAALSAIRAELVAPPSSVGAAVARLRAGLRDATDALPSDARGLVPGAAIGDTSRLPADLESAMRVAGLSHLVAVSGQHVAVVVLATLWLASVLRAPRWLRAVLALMAAVGFAVLVGAGPSVLRAVATGAVVAVGLGLGRRARPLPALAAVVIGLLVVDPWATGALGFQLSVVATAAIVLLATPAAVALGGDRWLARRLLPVLTVPLAAQSAVGPVLVLADPAVSWWAVPANVAVAPAVVPATLAGLVATVLAPVLPGVAVLVGRVAAVPTGWIAVVARTTAALPGASTPWTPGPAGAVGLAALVAAAWLAGRAVLAQARGGGVPRGAS
jgi:competence protein ComEC